MMNHPKEILQIGEPVLEQKTKKVSDLKSKKTRSIIKSLHEIFHKYEERSAGLAAPQIGKSLAICVVRRYDLEVSNQESPIKTTLLINPVIEKQSRARSTFWEGCLSIGWGDDGLFGPVERPEEVTVSYIDEDGKEQSLHAKGFFSHVVQHEIDHLEGILFLKYVKNPENIWRSGDLDEYYDKHQDYPPVKD